jgi:hypothetical protein
MRSPDAFFNEGQERGKRIQRVQAKTNIFELVKTERAV